MIKEPISKLSEDLRMQMENAFGKKELTDDKLIITKSLIGARIQDIKVQDGYIIIRYLVPSGRETYHEPINELRLAFDKNMVDVNSLVLYYELNEIRAEFELQSEYKAKTLIIDGNNGNYERLVFKLNK